MIASLVNVTGSPVTSPLSEPIAAMPVLLLLHVPGVVTSLNNVVKPAHTTLIPVIAAGNGLTVMVTPFVEAQPPPKAVTL